MLPEHYHRLLTGYVDGELDERERQQVERLLRRSGEARRLLAQLQGDAQALKNLPAPPPLPDLSDSILQAIADLRVEPRKARIRPKLVASRPFPAWLGLVAAASVLFAVALGSYLVFSGRPEIRTESPPLASRPEVLPVLPKEDVKEESTEVVRDQLPSVQEPPVRAKEPDLREPAPPVDAIVRVPAEEEDPPVPVLPPEKPPQTKVLTAPGLGMRDRFEKVELQLPAVVKLHELDSAPQRQKLLQELRPGNAFRLEILCRDATRSLERLRPALAASHIGLQIDSLAQTRLKKPQWKADFGLYLENVTPAELASVLEKAGVADRKAGAKKPSESRFDGMLVLSPLSRRDREELTDLFGLDPTRVLPAARLPLSQEPDVRKSLKDLTQTLIEDTLDGKGPPRPGAPTQNGFLVALAPTRSRPGAEVKRFLEGRKPARPQTVQVYLVLRNIY